ncbi:hypothetical protein YSA_10149 [Pseudomonas putida ND6]|uniref:Uncharacterized protein n=1 Tax=Pseudomonas putida ND6 TaxID=231023 RepID=I3V3F7_PSEPU|nr:hypothetical protein YSA_10149 [Pseudomonas putida ND6]
MYWIVHGLGEPVGDVLNLGLSRTYRWKNQQADGSMVS